MTGKRTRTVGRLRWLRLTTGERVTTCARFWLAPYGKRRVWWLYMREHGGDLRRTPWCLVYRSHKLATALLAAAVCRRATLDADALERGGHDPESTRAIRRRHVDGALAQALDDGTLAAERFDEPAPPAMALWGRA